MRAAAAVQLRVNVAVEIVDVATGMVRRRHEGHNLVVDAGLALHAAALAGGSLAVTDFALGRDDTAVDASDTALGDEAARDDITRVTPSGADGIAQYYLASGTLNGETLVEAGLYVGSTLLARFVFSDADLAPKTAATAAVFTWTLSYSAVEA